VTFSPAVILAALARHGVDYVLIGGLAVNAHGSRRGTRDVDIIVRRSPENMTRLVGALLELEVGSPVIDSRMRELDPLDPEDLATGANYTLDTAAGELDVLNDAKGAPPYDELAARSVHVAVAGTQVRVVGLDDLIALKDAAGRDVDLRDIADLTDRPADR
jgi:predicted nucleotidyltransferase